LVLLTSNDNVERDRRSSKVVQLLVDRAAEFPHASGVTEGASKSLIRARWQDHGLALCFLTRSLHLNSRLAGCIDNYLADTRSA
jgi:hypothetical protein